MQFPITPENFAAVLIAGGTGASAVLTAIGGMALWKKRKEPPPVGSTDAVAVSFAENTMVMKQMTGQFGDNLRMFGAIVEIVKAMAQDTAEQRRMTQDIKDHLAVLRDEIIRRRR